MFSLICICIELLLYLYLYCIVLLYRCWPHLTDAVSRFASPVIHQLKAEGGAFNFVIYPTPTLSTAKHLLCLQQIKYFSTPTLSTAS